MSNNVDSLNVAAAAAIAFHALTGRTSQLDRPVAPSMKGGAGGRRDSLAADSVRRLRDTLSTLYAVPDMRQSLQDCV